MSNKPSVRAKQPRVPPDHILINERWRGTQLGKEMCQNSGGIYSNELGIIDFYPCDGVAVLYFSTSEYAAQDYKKRLKSFYEASKQKGVVIADRNTETLADYTSVQEYATFSFNLFVFPVAGPQDVPTLLKDVSFIECSSPDNPFKHRTENVDLASKQLTLLTLIPNVGRKKAQELLEAFGHIKGISEASEEKLKSVSGPSVGKIVFQFFHQKHKTLS